jgi:hypothetical protein
LITIVGTVIVMLRNVFLQGEVTLDITVGKLFLSFELRERQLANQEFVHAKNQ